MNAKAGQRKGWEHATPRGWKDMFRHCRELSDEEKTETRRVAVDKIEEYQEAVRLVGTMSDSPMKKALVAKYQGIIDGLEVLLERL